MIILIRYIIDIVIVVIVSYSTSSHLFRVIFVEVIPIWKLVEKKRTTEFTVHWAARAVFLEMKLGLWIPEVPKLQILCMGPTCGSIFNLGSSSDVTQNKTQAWVRARMPPPLYIRKWTTLLWKIMGPTWSPPMCIPPCLALRKCSRRKLRSRCSCYFKWN